MNARFCVVVFIVVGLCGCEKETLDSEGKPKGDPDEVARADQAAAAAREGRVEEARRIFDEVTDGSNNWHVLVLAYQFYLRTGDLAAAEEVTQRALAIDGEHAKTKTTAYALGNLGLIYQDRGELDEADKMLRRALEIHENLGNQESIAGVYGNLGLSHQTLGELDEAEEMFRSALEIEQKLGSQEGMSILYGNLVLCQM